jgi:hypothetical protein
MEFQAVIQEARSHVLRKLNIILLAQVALACLMPITLSAQNLISNPGFEKPAAGVPPGTPVTFTTCLEDGGSAAADWTVWLNTCDTSISTELIPSTAPSGGKFMLHVVTNGNGNGIFQDFAKQTKTLSSVWVFVNSGCVGMGTGNAGDTLQSDEMTCETGSWIQFKAPSGQSPASEFIVYEVEVALRSGALGPPGADFYVDNVSVRALEP